jgi:uncharacterized protein YcsI (UPF0317 family)
MRKIISRSFDRVFRNGELVDEVTDVRSLWRNDLGGSIAVPSQRGVWLDARQRW